MATGRQCLYRQYEKPSYQEMAKNKLLQLLNKYRRWLSLWQIISLTCWRLCHTASGSSVSQHGPVKSIRGTYCTVNKWRLCSTCLLLDSSNLRDQKHELVQSVRHINWNTMMLLLFYLLVRPSLGWNVLHLTVQRLHVYWSVPNLDLVLHSKI